VLRQGTNPVQRPNGSGAGIAALIAEGNPGANAEEISFVRMSRAPKASEYSAYSASVAALHQNTADTQLDVAKISDDPLEVAYATRDNLAHAVTSNIPAAGLTVAELTAIYNCTDTNWSQIPGATGSDTIIPLVPQTGSGTRSTFLGDLGITNPGPCVQTVEENDPTALTNAVETANSVEATTTPASGTASAADAIDPFSVGRLNLYNSGYFTDPTVVFPGGAALTPGIAVKTGTGTSPTSDIYLDNRGLYIVFRDSDLSDAAWQPGAAASQNWATVLFWSGANPSYMQSAAGAALIAAGGGVADYAKEPAGFTG
jgi:hypothetical protein